MDVAYVVRPGEANQELRYSLRSLINVPHDRVFIGGYVPKWTRNVVPVPRRQTSMRFVNSSLNLYAICQSDISEQFIFFNDDFFVMRKLTEIKPLNRGPLDEVMERHRVKFGRNSYYHGMATTRDWLLHRYKITEPLSYGLHIPMVVDRDLMWRLLEETRIDKPQGRPQYHMRTIYGNVAEVGGDAVGDVKLAGTRKGVERYRFLSTSEKSFASGNSGRLIRATFTDPSPYEAAVVRPTPKQRVDRRMVKRPVINR